MCAKGTFRSMLLSALASLFFAAQAYADQIDGSWCKPNSTDRMHINGSEVTTPAGNLVIAQYTRHSVEYDVPEGEIPIGGRIRADQIDDERIDVAQIKKVQLEPPAHDVWTRCEQIS